VNRILIVIPIGIVGFVALLLVPQMYQDKQEITFSKESCEAFNGRWVEQEFACYGIESEDCGKMKRTFEIAPCNMRGECGYLCK